MAVLTASFQIVSLMGYIAMVIAALVLWHHHKEARPLIIYPAVWAFLGVIFYTLLLGGRLTIEWQLLFGAIHRMLSMVMGLGFLFGLWAIMIAPPDDDADHLNERD